MALATVLCDNSSMTKCVLRNNSLGLKGWIKVCKTLRPSRSSKITTWDLSYEQLGPEIAKPLADYLAVTASITQVLPY